MGLCNSPNIFQEKMNELFIGIKNIQAYIYDLLILGKLLWNKHIQQLDKVFKRLQYAGLKVNVTKSFFGKHKIEYLGYIISR